MVTRQTASMENYLEAMTMLREENKAVTVTQISKMLRVRKPSVTAALKKLSQEGLVEHKRYGDVRLTAEGEEIAEDVFHRHETLRHLLAEILNIDPKVAAEDACKMEHCVSPATMERLTKFVEFVLNCPRGQPEWLEGFNYYFEHGERTEELLARCQRDDR